MDMEEKMAIRGKRWKPQGKAIWQGVLALLIGGVLWLFFPQTSFAQADLQAATPKPEALLRIAPRQVHLWVSEPVSPTANSIVVVNDQNQGVEGGTIRVGGDDTRELEVDLQPSLPPGVYVVAWQVASRVDGRVTDGSFQFTILLPNGRLPSTIASTIPGLHETSQSSLVDFFDGTTLLLVGATILRELFAVFWTGAALWRGLILPVEEEMGADRDLVMALHRRFEQRWAWSTLVLLFLAHAAWIIAHLMMVGVDVLSSSFSTIASSVIGDIAGRLWIGQIVLLLLALRLSIFRLQQRDRPLRLSTLLNWGDLSLGLGFFAVLALSRWGDATASGQVVLPVLFAWGYLLATALGIGGLLFLAGCCLSLLHRQEREIQARFFLTVVPTSSRLVLASLVLMAVTGFFQVTEHVQQWSDLLTTSYGRVVVSQSLLEGVLLLMSGLVMGRFQPQLRQIWESYRTMRLSVSKLVPLEQQSEEPLRSLAQQMKSQEMLLVHQIQQMKRILWVEAGIGIAILIGTGLLTVLANLPS